MAEIRRKACRSPIKGAIKVILAGLFLMGTHVFAQDVETTIYQAAGIHPFSDASVALPGAAALTTTANQAKVALHATGLETETVYTVWAVLS